MRMSISPQLIYYDFGPRVTAFSTMRQGGCSTGNYAAFNINRYCGDSPVHIADNLHALSALLGLSEQNIIMPHQTHGIRVCRIDTPPTTTIEDTDAVMTDTVGLCIGVSTADCIPILLYDADHHAACAVHAGWRGTVQRIVREAVNAMQCEYQTVPSRLQAVIGPGISLENFEVGDEVFQQFAAANFDMAAIARRYEKWHIDLPVCNRLQLEELGVTDIHLSGICTFQQYERFFSARRLGVQSGRIYTAILLK